MKIEIYNLGPIHSFQMDLDKDLYLIFGRNNIGKSYAISAVYLILKHLINFEIIQQLEIYQIMHLMNQKQKDDIHLIRNGANFHPLWFRKKTEAFLKKKQASLDLTGDFTNELKNVLNETLMRDLHDSFLNTFGDTNHLQNQFQEEPFAIWLKMPMMSLKIGLDNQQLYILDLNLTKQLLVKKKEKPTSFRNFKKSLTFYISPHQNPESSDLSQAIFLGLRWLLEGVEDFEATYFLPASRSGLYSGLNTFNVMVAELSQQRQHLQQRKISLPTIPEPVSDYFLNLSSIKSSQILNQDLMALAEEMENALLDGSIYIDKDTRTLRYRPRDVDIELDLAFTSSMVSEIAPIIAHFKYIIADKSRRLQPKSIAPKQSILFIEEPEAHLHPALQVKLTELFEKLSHYNVKIVVTTHSNYIFNKISNLVLAESLSPQNIGVALMDFQPGGSVILEHAMTVDKDGIEDNNFANIAEELYRERMNLYAEANDVLD